MTELTLIVNWLNIYYLIEVTALVLLPLGADPNASIYKVQASDQKTYFVKLKRGHFHDINVEVLELLQRAAIQQLIAPIKTVSGTQIQQVDDFTLIVYPFVEGQDGFSHSLTEKQWIALGRALKQVHEVHVPTPLKAQIRREEFSAKWRDVVRALYVEAVPTHDEITSNLWKFLQEHKSTIQQLVDRSEQLSKKASKNPLEFVLCHSDIHGGNVLLDGKEALYIVDWDDPILAPKERDLMFIGGGVGNVWNKSHEEKLFYQGYGQTDVDWTLIAYYRYERIVEDIAVYAQELLLKPIEGNNRLEMHKQFMSMFEPHGVVDIAFATDKHAERISMKEEANQICFVECTSKAEWDFAKKLRMKYFFEPLSIDDPYTWTFDHEEHVHFILYQGDTMVGYAHIQLWADHRAALRIMAIDEQYRNSGLGSQFLHLCEQWLKKHGVKSLHDEARPSAIQFYRNNDYVEMPFNDPSGEPPSPYDLAMGKLL